MVQKLKATCSNDITRIKTRLSSIIEAYTQAKEDLRNDAESNRLKFLHTWAITNKSILSLLGFIISPTLLVAVYRHFS